MEQRNLTVEYRHQPVMLAEVLQQLNPKPGEIVCDCTLGGAGHTVELAKRIVPDGLSIGIDQDDMAHEAAAARIAKEVPAAEFLPLKGNFGDLDTLLVSAEVPGVDCRAGFFVSRRCPVGYAHGSGETNPNRTRGRKHLYRS